MNRKALIAVAEVDNPWFAPEHPEGLSNPRKVAAALRPDALQWMARRDKIKPHQVAAGVRFGKFWELREGLRSGGLHEYVDLGRLPTIYDDVIDAGRELRRCQAVLSKNDYWLVSEVCGRGLAPSQLFHGKRLRSRRERAYKDLAAALDDLACMWRYMNGRAVDKTASARP
jgi:hypothetical protein